MDSILPSNNEINSAAVDEAFKIANNAIYFNDSSDYLSALYQICKKLNPAISEYNIGLEYLEECSIKNIDQNVVLNIDSSSIDTVCYSCPTIFVFKDNDNNSYYFRLRHGGWRICKDDSDKLIASGSTSEYDGCCTWEEAVKLATEENLTILSY